MNNRVQEEKWLLDEKYGGIKDSGFKNDLKRLQSGEPLAYIIGHIPFSGVTICLDSRPLIPRIETEFWVEQAIRSMQGRSDTTLHILDLCAGSGCIGIAILKNITSACLDFVEIDTSHHSTIKKNITSNGIDPERGRVLSGDLFENVTQTYDYILVNPPYIDPRAETVAPSVKDHEPEIALFGGTEGAVIIRRILKAAPRYLRSKGEIYIEHEPAQVPIIADVAKRCGFDTAHYKDQYGIQRFTVLTRAQA